MVFKLLLKNSNKTKIGVNSQTNNKPYFYTVGHRGMFYWLIKP